MGRTLSLLETDGSTVANTYSGNSTIATDEALNARRSFTDALGRLIEVDEPGTAPGSPATPSTGNVSINGTLQSKQVLTQAATAGQTTITIDISGDPNQISKVIYPCGNSSCPQTIYNFGNVSVTGNGILSGSAYYNGQSSTIQSVVSDLVTSINQGSSLVTATAGSGSVTITAKTQGASTNYTFTESATWYNGTCPDHNPCFGSPGFYIDPYPGTGSGALSGGHDAVYTTVYDQGTTTITINGQAIPYSWSGSGTTSASIAQNLAGNVTSSSSYATATYSGSTVYLTSRSTGSG